MLIQPLESTRFQTRTPPNIGSIAGYGAIIEAFSLPLPLPNRLVWVSKKYQQQTELAGRGTEIWLVFPPTYAPANDLYAHLIFALKYEGINLLFFKKLFEHLPQTDLLQLIQTEPTGIYSRKIWFLYEWLMEKKLEIPDLAVAKKMIPLVDTDIQFAVNEGIISKRHRIINNLPGTVNFCPLIFKTQKLLTYIQSDFSKQQLAYLAEHEPNIVRRAAGYLLLKDSKTSFGIEGENPSPAWAQKWGKEIGKAGEIPLSKQELLRLQKSAIENHRFKSFGFRQAGGFVGEHDIDTRMPIPAHISAKSEDLEKLLDGLIDTYAHLEHKNFPAVLAAAKIAFGFVFIHPFSDGNGRTHRYLVHHVLSRLKFSQEGHIFPISKAILDTRMQAYRKVLEAYSTPLLDFIQWETTKNHNITVLNETLDYYRYFDATVQAEFLYACVEETIQKIIPKELEYLKKYDAFKDFLDAQFQLSDKMVSLLVGFLTQNKGKFSARMLQNEFKDFNTAEASEIEIVYAEIFGV